MVQIKAAENMRKMCCQYYYQYLVIYVMHCFIVFAIHLVNKELLEGQKCFLFYFYRDFRRSR